MALNVIGSRKVLEIKTEALPQRLGKNRHERHNQETARETPARRQSAAGAHETGGSACRRAAVAWKNLRGPPMPDWSRGGGCSAIEAN